MYRMIAITTCAFALPGLASAATRNYDVGPFEGVSVSAGIKADITLGSARSVIADTGSENAEDLRIVVEGKVLRIERTPRSWFANLFSGTHEGYVVHVVTPALRSLTASSGAKVTVNGNVEGDFSVSASSGSKVNVSSITGGAVKATASSGSDLEIAGRCVSIEAEASSGSDLDAKELQCDSARVHASSGSDLSVSARQRVEGSASSGSDVQVRGKPAQVQLEKSSGADVTVPE